MSWSTVSRFAPRGYSIRSLVIAVIIIVLGCTFINDPMVQGVVTFGGVAFVVLLFFLSWIQKPPLDPKHPNIDNPIYMEAWKTGTRITFALASFISALFFFAGIAAISAYGFMGLVVAIVLGGVTLTLALVSVLHWQDAIAKLAQAAQDAKDKSIV